MSDEAHASQDLPDGDRRLTWPPPGLERMQGDLGVIATRAALAGALLALPLLFVVAREQDFATQGPFADAWWVTIIFATVGLAFALDALVRLVRTMRRASRALESGYRAATVLQVLADSTRDMGFLLTGARHFSVMDAHEREVVASIRIAALALVVASGLWLTVALCVGLFFAARGLISPLGLQMVTLVPASIGYMTGGVATMVQEGRVRRARKVWHKQPWSADLTSEELRRWQAGVGGETPPKREAGLAQVVKGMAFVVGGLAIVVALPVFTLMPASAVGPIVTAIAMPGLDNFRPRAARVEAFRTYATDGDVAITPIEAGELLQVLMYVGSTEEPSAGERAPARQFAQPWLPDAGDAPNPFGLNPFTWGDSLIGRVADGVGPEQRAYLAQIAAHPAAGEFSRLAQATEIDVGSARWERPFPPGTTMATIPIPDFSTIRKAANAHIAAAAYEVVKGDNDRAERLLSEVISVGFLLSDQGPTLIDNVIGHRLVNAGGAALEDLYRVSGQIEAAAELSRLKQVAERVAALIRVQLTHGSAEAWVRALPEIVLDSALARGIRWEYFIGFTTMAPCLNLHGIVFGADDSYTAFIEEARESLVRWPSDEAVFQIAKHGWIGAVEPVNPPLLGTILSLYMNTRDNSCSALVRHMQAADVF